MCRILGYLGPELPLEDLLLKPSNSLVNQSRAPKLHPLMQLAGWGFGAWSESYLKPEQPMLYRRQIPAFFDDNARTVLPSLKAHTVVAHVRAATYRSETVLAYENCHPFSFEGSPWILVHNGSVPHWRILQRELLSHCKSEYLSQIRGTTDSEFLFCLLLSILEGHELSDFEKAFVRLLELLVDAMKKCGNVKSCKLKLALASPQTLVAVNYGSGHNGETQLQGDWKELRKAELGSPDFLLSTVLEPLYLSTGRDFEKEEGCYSMNTCSDKDLTTMLLASEPLTEDTEVWDTLDFGYMMMARREDEKIESVIRKLDL